MIIPYDDLPADALSAIVEMRRAGYRVKVRQHANGTKQVDVRHDEDDCPDVVLDTLCRLTGASIATASRPRED